MSASTIGKWPVRILLLTAILAAIAQAGFAQTSPAFSTQNPVSGMVNGTFVVFLPLANTGTATASNIQLTSATLGLATLTSPSMPLLLGTLAPTNSHVLDLRFNGSNVTLARNYLLTVRGTYQFNGATLGFSLNRIINIASASNLMRTEVEHWTVMDAIDTYQASLPGLDHDADMQSLLAFLQSRPEFVDSGSTSDFSSVWAHFANGEEIIIADDRPLSDNSVTATRSNSAPTLKRGIPTEVAHRYIAPAVLEPTVFHPGQYRPASLMFASPLITSGSSLPTELPAARKAKVFNTFGRGFDDTQLAADLTSLLQDQKYDVASSDATVDTLKTVGGEGVFYITSHGGFASRNNYAVWTSTKGDLATEMVDLASGRLLDSDILGTPTTPPTLVRMNAIEEIDPNTKQKVKEWHYAFTAQFVRTYWKPFALNSLVYIDACLSDVGSDFRQAMFDNNASVYVGWTFKVPDAFAAGTARLVFDRLLGANKFELEAGFKQRPFDYLDVQTDLPLHNLGVKGVVEFLNFRSNADPALGQFALLAPTVISEWLDEERAELHITGIFGQDPGEGTRSVSVGGVAQHIKSWDPNEIVVDNLPVSGAGSVGEVQILVRQHRSNAGMLSRWHTEFRFSIGSLGSIMQDVTYHLVLRGDVRKVRSRIHFPPDASSGTPSVNAPASSATYSCSGSYQEGPDQFQQLGTWTWSWTGSGDLFPLAPGENLSVQQPRFIVIANITSDQVLFSIGNSGYPGCNTNLHLHIPNDPDIDIDGPGQHAVNAPSDNPPFFGPFIAGIDSNATIYANTIEKDAQYDFPGTFNPAGTIAHAILRWGDMSAESPPDPDSAR